MTNVKSKRRHTVCTVVLLGAILIGCSIQPNEPTEITISATQGTETSVTVEQPIEAIGDTIPTESTQVTESTDPTSATEDPMAATESMEETTPTESAPTTEPTPTTKSTRPPATEPSQNETTATAPPATELSTTEDTVTELPSNEPAESGTTESEPRESETIHTHSYTEEVVEATCQSQGYTQYTCICGDTYWDSYSDRAKHQYVTVETVWQTLESDGYQRIECFYGCGKGETIILPRLTEYIDTAALSHSGNEYAVQYGYAANTNCSPENGAGYYPALRKKITTMEEGYQAARAAVDSQYRFDISCGVDTRGLPVNVYFQPTEDPTVFYIYVYYGGDCG